MYHLRVLDAGITLRSRAICAKRTSKPGPETALPSLQNDQGSSLSLLSEDRV